MDALHEIVHRLSCLLDAPVVIEDHRFNLVAHSAHVDRTDQLRSDSILHRGCDESVRQHFEAYGVARADRPLLIPASPDGTILARWCLPVRCQGIVRGYVWSIASPTGFTRLPDEAMGLAEAIGELLMDRSRRDAARSRAVGRLLETTDAAEADAALSDIERCCSWMPDHQVTVVVARGPWRHPAPSTLLALSAVHAELSGSDAVLLVPHERAGRHHGPSHVAAAFGATGDEGWTIGIGEAVPVFRARTSWIQARAAARAAGLEGGGGPALLSWADLGVRRLLSAGSTSWLAASVMPPSVRDLLDHGDPALVDTARMYLDLAGQVQLTANRLAIHRQTLYRRLRRVEDIAGLDLMDGHDRLVLHLGLTLAPDLTNRADAGSP